MPIRAAHRDEQLLGVLLQHLHQRHLGLRAALLHLGEQRALRDGHPDPEADHDERAREQERDAPAPRQERLFGQHDVEQREDACGQQVADRDADLRPAGVEPSPVRRAVLERHQHGATPLAAEPEPLREPQDDEQDRGGDADGGVGGQQADEERRDTHDQQSDDEHLLAADAVAEMAEDDAAERPGEEPDGVRREGQQGADQRVERGEEQRVEHQRRGRAVEEEVVPLQRRPDEAGDDHLAGRAGRRRW